MLNYTIAEWILGDKQPQDLSEEVGMAYDEFRWNRPSMACNQVAVLLLPVLMDKKIMHVLSPTTDTTGEVGNMWRFMIYMPNGAVFDGYKPTIAGAIYDAIQQLIDQEAGCSTKST